MMARALRATPLAVSATDRVPGTALTLRRSQSLTMATAHPTPHVLADDAICHVQLVAISFRRVSVRYVTTMTARRAPTPTRLRATHANQIRGSIRSSLMGSACRCALAQGSTEQVRTPVTHVIHHAPPATARASKAASRVMPAAHSLTCMKERAWPSAHSASHQIPPAPADHATQTANRARLLTTHPSAPRVAMTRPALLSYRWGQSLGTARLSVQMGSMARLSTGPAWRAPPHALSVQLLPARSACQASSCSMVCVAQPRQFLRLARHPPHRMSFLI